MRSIEEDKGCHGDISSHHHRTSKAFVGKPTPSKWDDAQKWLVGFSTNKNQTNQPRNSNADDTRLIAPVPPQEEHYSSSYAVAEEDPVSLGIRSICLRDMGTEMTPIASQDPSRTATPIRALSPIASGSTTPVRSQIHNINANIVSHQPTKSSPLETRALAWDEAERAKYTARYKREELKIQAWENHEKRKAEMGLKKMEVKAERLKARGQERMANKLAATKRIAEEKRANAEATMNEKAISTSEKADYIRRSGHLPSSFSFSFKLPSLCGW